MLTYNGFDINSCSYSAFQVSLITSILTIQFTYLSAIINKCSCTYNTYILLYTFKRCKIMFMEFDKGKIILIRYRWYRRYCKIITLRVLSNLSVDIGLPTSNRQMKIIISDIDISVVCVRYCLNWYHIYIAIWFRFDIDVVILCAILLIST